MAKRSKGLHPTPKTPVSKAPARSLALAKLGVTTSQGFAAIMAALMSDILEQRITPQIANATCNAGGKLLKIVELQMKHQTGAKHKRLGLSM